MNQTEAMKVLAEAYEVQESIARMRKNLKAKEELYRGLMERLAMSDVGRVGDYERRRRVISRRVIRSDAFRAAWPELFNQCEVTLKDAEGSRRKVIRLRHRGQRWRIMFYRAVNDWTSRRERGLPRQAPRAG